MVVVPLTSFVLNGQTKWRLISERRSEKQVVSSSQTSPSILKVEKSNKGGKLHKCNTCSFSTSFENNLKTHVRRHNPEKLFKCDQCSYEANQKGILQIHVRNVHYDLWYRCDKCEYKASQKSNLKRHTQIEHEGMMYFRCDRCSFKAWNSQKLEKHMQDNVHENFRDEFTLKAHAHDFP